MTERKLYTCDICHTDYLDQSMALKCEKSHKQPLDIAGARYVACKRIPLVIRLQSQ